ncbi:MULTISPECIES: N-acetylneuraminate synthase [Pseudomonadati]|uniref:N-acetylneuraminate synthase n=1 Tax=Shewanella aestuarii TaxID=1028752 RepID=A0ABT0L1W9_9GAMM|nr:N-acetylneuraminate synthase [Shewanella aestuarii]MCL1117733.1 N-acetylneuraminate synthase [Shewanella aestuarii]GGN76724.1 N-acetylneuraminate synthase [Shewanella aestuarii]
MKPVLVIAEAGVNHNGSLEMAFKLVDVAVDAGADIVKFQTFKAKNLVTADACKAQYQIEATGNQESQLAMLTRLELSYDAHHQLLEYCASKNIEFLSTAFDSESLAFLVNDIKVKRLKIPSGELTNSPFVLDHARSGLDIILSTGMATLEEVKNALSVIAFGYVSPLDMPPSLANFELAFSSDEGQKALSSKVTILHCTTEYPAPFEEVNLNVMDTLKRSFGLPVGYSDHTQGIAIPIAAVAKEAVVIEKHFTLDCSLPGPDHLASIEPLQLKVMVESIRHVEQALGHGIKKPSLSEVKNIPIARKSIVAQTDIKQGEPFNVRNLTIKRPGTGMSPDLFWQLTSGQVASKSYLVGDLIDE